jgi:hypothetical protein
VDVQRMTQLEYGTNIKEENNKNMIIGLITIFMVGITLGMYISSQIEKSIDNNIQRPHNEIKK